jgi:hypothetical protein
LKNWLVVAALQRLTDERKLTAAQANWLSLARADLAGLSTK